MKTAIALMLLVGPPLSLFGLYIREYGLTISKPGGWNVFSLLAVLLLLASVAVILSGEAGRVLNAPFFPFRGILIFFVSGVAFSAAIFPGVFAQYTGTLPKADELRLEWLIAVPAWMWILVVIALVVLEYAF
ncbi:hypothetical protein [Wenzhouxiangella sp. EGI_FJ10305]|uniref:hypothetical protein n=1 Tax=Wenzhouxiangella sp. EGI_FJ10305 TaxID=3243768 RepID=UPI0035DBF97C